MVEGSLIPQPAFAGIATPDRFGRQGGTAGVTAREVTGCGLASIGVRRGQGDAFAAAARGSFGLDLTAASARPRRVVSRDLALIWSGPDQWLAMATPQPPQGMEALLAPALGAHSAIVDQSHARLILRLSGPRIRDTFAKGLPIDLDPRVFGPGDAALSQIAHIGVQIWQLDAASNGTGGDGSPTYELAAPRGFAGSLWHWLLSSAAEFGLELTA